MSLGRIAAFSGSIIASLIVGACGVGASTFACQFGESSGVGLCNGTWEHGTKHGSISIVYKRDGPSAHGTRQVAGDEANAATVILGEKSMQFVSTWQVAPGSVVEVMTMVPQAGKFAAVRTVHAVSGPGASSALTDFGVCEMVP